MESTIDKKRIIKAMEELPEDATVEQAIYKLYVLDQVSKALSHSGEKKSQDEVKKQLLNKS
ncbi:hypothetical protein [Gracilimonas mengyeensis]|uniref:Uncharacterized protein n=1 Tax=Gracilimonas mengyeensis TaxID=1302730 RepID=A0A521E3T6_9BACT|nr:hypothetical protein [Gracilimonas mengyeensis]SMO78606.1 hypothetical protein SAMN06265219_110130 [Gracilimonas mengyeensis]